MVRFWIVAVMVTVGTTAAGCAPDTGGSPRGPGEREALASEKSASEEMTSEEMTEFQDAPSFFAPPPNPRPVPRVVGMTVRRAQLTLAREKYGCAIAAGLRMGGGARGGAEARRVVAQAPEPGSAGFRLEDVLLAVSRPYPAGRMPQSTGCIDVQELGYTDGGLRDIFRRAGR